VIFRIFTLLAVLGLAISTWFLSSASRRVAPVDAKRINLPGYYLKHTVLTDYDAAGNPGIRIEAERIDQVDHGTEVAMYNVRVNYAPPGGQNWQIIGDVAHVEPGGRVVNVSGNVRLQGESTGIDDVAVIRTDTLRYDLDDSVASTKSDVRIDFGPHVLTARGMSANLKERTMRLESKVNGRFIQR
jgi:LPS export ABC transporter protein LptC